MKTLFILKRNETYGFSHYCRRSSGLWNSVSFVVRAMKERGIHCEMTEVHDNNDIDREVTKYRPDIVVIEALWVVPEKFDILKKLHPKVEWLIHMHSGVPFLALEGNAMDWLYRYQRMGLKIIANSWESYRALSSIVPSTKLVYLENCYQMTPSPLYWQGRPIKDPSFLDVACFGAVRPMKNHLLQALASLQLSQTLGKPLRFHINATRLETGGEPVLKNLKALFEHSPGNKLVLCDWMELDRCIDYLRYMDLGMQVSMSETFNFVAANYVEAGTPMVVSKEISWASKFSQAKDNAVDDIVKKSLRALRWPSLVKWNRHLLEKHAALAEQKWFEFLK